MMVERQGRGMTSGLERCIFCGLGNEALFSGGDTTKLERYLESIVINVWHITFDNSSVSKQTYPSVLVCLLTASLTTLATYYVLTVREKHGLELLLVDLRASNKLSHGHGEVAGFLGRKRRRSNVGASIAGDFTSHGAHARTSPHPTAGKLSYCILSGGSVSLARGKYFGHPKGTTLSRVYHLGRRH